MTVAQSLASLSVRLKDVPFQVVDEKGVLHVVKQAAELLFASAQRLFVRLRSTISPISRAETTPASWQRTRYNVASHGP